MIECPQDQGGLFQAAGPVGHEHLHRRLAHRPVQRRAGRQLDHRGLRVGPHARVRIVEHGAQQGHGLGRRLPDEDFGGQPADLGIPARHGLLDDRLGQHRVDLQEPAQGDRGDGRLRIDGILQQQLHRRIAAVMPDHRRPHQPVDQLPHGLVGGQPAGVVFESLGLQVGQRPGRLQAEIRCGVRIKGEPAERSSRLRFLRRAHALDRQHQEALGRAGIIETRQPHGPKRPIVPPRQGRLDRLGHVDPVGGPVRGQDGRGLPGVDLDQGPGRGKLDGRSLRGLFERCEQRACRVGQLGHAQPVGPGNRPGRLALEVGLGTRQGRQPQRLELGRELLDLRGRHLDHRVAVQGVVHLRAPGGKRQSCQQADQPGNLRPPGKPSRAVSASHLGSHQFNSHCGRVNRQVWTPSTRRQRTDAPATNHQLAGTS